RLLRRRRKHRTPLPASGRSRYALLCHDRFRDRDRRQGHGARSRLDGSGADRARGSRRVSGRTAEPVVARSVYFFGAGRADGRAGLRNRLGGKGANLAEMTRIGIPVPPGFTIATEVANAFASRGGRVPRAVTLQARAALRRVERIADARFGDPE